MRNGSEGVGGRGGGVLRLEKCCDGGVEGRALVCGDSCLCMVGWVGYGGGGRGFFFA